MIENKVLCPFYPVDVPKGEDYFKISSDALEGDIISTREKSALSIAKLISGKNVHAHGRGFPFPEISGILAKTSVYTPHFNTTGSNWYMKIIRAFLFNRFNKVIAQTEFGKDSLVRDGVNPKKLVIIPNHIDLEKFSNPLGGAEFRKKHNLKQNDKVCLAIGMRDLKNTKTIIQACNDSGSKLLLVGHKDMTDISPGFEWLLPSKDLLDLEDDNIIFTGLLNENELLAAYDASTMFINSSSYESFCLAAYEASAAGIPLCLPNIGTFNIFKSSALFHTPKDSMALSKNIQQYLDNVDLVSKHTSQNMEIVRDFSYDNVFKKLQSLYKELGMII